MTLQESPSAAQAVPASPPLHVVAWEDPVVDGLGHDPRSRYAETFWLGVLGPTTTFFLRMTAFRFDRHPEGFDIDLDDAAGALGIGGYHGRNAPLQRALQRCAIFELARPAGPGALAVRRRLPPLAQRHLIRLPVALQDHHRAWIASHREGPSLEVLRQRSQRLALSLLELGEEQQAVEHQLVRWRFHPALAHASAEWAAARHHHRPGRALPPEGVVGTLHSAVAAEVSPPSAHRQELEDTTAALRSQPAVGTDGGSR